MAGKIKQAVDSAMSKLVKAGQGSEKLYEKIVPIPPIATYTELPFALVTRDSAEAESAEVEPSKATSAKATKTAPAKAKKAGNKKDVTPPVPKKKAKAAKKRKS